MQILSTISNKPHRYKFSEIDNWVPFDPYEISISADGQDWTSIYDDADLKNILCSDYSIPHSINTVTAQKFGVRNGQIVTSMSFTERTISLNFIGKASKSFERKLMLNSLEKFFAQVGQYWICFGDQPYKKYHVTYSSMTPGDEAFPMFQCTVTLEDYDGIAQSVVSSSDIRQFSTNGWAAGMGFPFNKDTPYQFSGESSFSVFNPSDISIDPMFQRHPLVIKVYGTGYFQLNNISNGSEITCYKQLSAQDTFQISKTSPTINGFHAGSNTDNGYIKLSKGWNDFNLLNIKNSKVSFEFPFYYLT